MPGWLLPLLLWSLFLGFSESGQEAIVTVFLLLQISLSPGGRGVLFPSGAKAVGTHPPLIAFKGGAQRGLMVYTHDVNRDRRIPVEVKGQPGLPSKT